MASRLARSATGTLRLRPSASVPASRALPLLTSTHHHHQQLQARNASSSTPPVPTEEPAQKAQSIIDALPGSSLISKTAILSTGAGVSIWAIANEIYVVNEETIVAFATLSVFAAIFRYMGPMYKEWAQAHIDKVRNILYTAKENHMNAVRGRIDDVGQLGGVIDITKNLFEVSKETAHLEAQAYELEQKTALAHEAKTVLDSWVRYEGQVKNRRQKELAESVIAKVTKELENPKNMQTILSQSIADVEKIVASKAQ